MILKNRQGQIRLIWHLLMLLVPFLLIAYLLRYIPIRIQVGILTGQGLSGNAASTQARRMFLEDPVWVSVIGIIQGLLWYVLVCVLIRFIEKEPCQLKRLGWSCHGKGVLFLLFGFLIGLVMYFAYFVVGRVFGESPFTWSPVRLSILPLILVSLDMLSNGFGEETAFRAYWQRLAIDRHGLWVAIVVASASFVLLHLLIAPLTAVALVASILLACFYGILYVWTGSIFLVGALHTTFNLAPRLLGQWPSDIGLLLVNSLALTIAVIVYARFRRGARG